MAQDFGDESGEMLLRALKRSVVPISKKVFNHFKNQPIQDNPSNPTSPQPTHQVSELQPSGYLCLPFGSTDNTRDFIQECTKNGISVIGLTDNNHNGFIFLESHNYEAIEKLVPSFLKENNIDIDAFIRHQYSIEPMSEEKMIQIFSLIQGDDAPPPPAPAAVKEMARPETLTDTIISSAPERDFIIPDNKTGMIAREVLLAQDHATNMEEFRFLLA